MLIEVVLRRFEQATGAQQPVFLPWLKAAYPRAHRDRIRAVPTTDPRFQIILDLLYGEDLYPAETSDGRRATR